MSTVSNTNLIMCTYDLIVLSETTSTDLFNELNTISAYSLYFSSSSFTMLNGFFSPAPRIKFLLAKYGNIQSTLKSFAYIPKRIAKPESKTKLRNTLESVALLVDPKMNIDNYSSKYISVTIGLPSIPKIWRMSVARFAVWRTGA